MLSKKKISLIIVGALITTYLGMLSTTVKAAPKNTKTENVIKEEALDGGNPEKKKLTIMMYMDADNNLEGALLNDIQEMKQGYDDNADMNVIVMVDRTPGYSSNAKILGENFTDTRMYKVQHNKVIRIDGGNEFTEITKKSRYEANMGDANTLKKFINSCKTNYPADKYMLIMSNHGGGAKDNESAKNLNKAVCWDDSNGDDCLYTAEISDVLGQEQSVDVLGFDACLMGTAEVAYQFRPDNGRFQANVMVASSPVVWGNGLPYKSIFNRLRNDVGTTDELDETLGGREKKFNPATITDNELAAVIIEEQRDSVYDGGVTDQQFSAYDLTKVQGVKDSVDSLARSLSVENEKNAMEALRGSKENTGIINYFDERDEMDWINYPYFDLYDLCEKVTDDRSFSLETKYLANEVMKNTDDMILYSFAQGDFKSFKESKNGVSMFFPNGSQIYVDEQSGAEIPHWRIQRWYNSEDTMAKGLRTPYGKLSWCIDGIDSEKNKVGNWFELLDSWYDSSNDKKGGSNAFQW